MNLWHLTPDAPRFPARVSAGENVNLQIGTYPIEPNQSAWMEYHVARADGSTVAGRVDAAWNYNAGNNSYWYANFGPFADGDEVTYTIHGRAPDGQAVEQHFSFRVGPKLFLALLWHQHQPIYKDSARIEPRGSYLYPWVRLHAIRDYYSMAALVAEHPEVHLTINLTPALLWQIEDYLARRATDRALELTLTDALDLQRRDQEDLLSNFFDADWHGQIFPHLRYKELFIQRRQGLPFTTRDLRDLQMWFNLAWFGQEFREGEVKLMTGEVASVKRFVGQGRGFTADEIREMVGEQYRIMRAIVPLHRALQARGQIEVSTTPFYHPILPLLYDTNLATLDRAGATLPPRFAHPEDAEAQVARAVDFYREHFGRAPRGMWPAEGAVGQSVVPLLARHEVHWIATDRGVLKQSGAFGYRVEDPDVLCQPYRAQSNGDAVSVFFRDTELSDAIGFDYYRWNDPPMAARDFVRKMKERFAWQNTGDDDRVLTVVLDGENAWGAYRDDARPFLHALYTELERDAEIRTVTFAEYIKGNAARRIPPHPPESQMRVSDLYHASWIDENGSAQNGVDLGTWIGEPEENRAWELLGAARQFVEQKGATPDTAPAAFESLYTAEGSDWFWWYGEDQDSGRDDEFDDLFRMHLKNVYRALNAPPPANLDEHIVPRAVVWTFTRPVERVQHTDRLTVLTNCPGLLTWRIEGTDDAGVNDLIPAGGVMAGVGRYHWTLGPFADAARMVRFTFRCTRKDCDGKNICCKPDEHVALIL